MIRDHGVRLIEAYVLVNGAVAFEGDAGKLGEDHALQSKLLGVVHDGESTSVAEERIAQSGKSKV